MRSNEAFCTRGCDHGQIASYLASLAISPASAQTMSERSLIAGRARGSADLFRRDATLSGPAPLNIGPGVRNKLLRGQQGPHTGHGHQTLARPGCRAQIHQDNAKCFAAACNSSLRVLKSVTNVEICSMYTLLISAFGLGDTEIQTAAHVIWTMCTEEELWRW